MRKFYQEKLSKEYDSNKIFLNITGGTPAMAFGLLYNASINASCRVIPFYTKQNTNRTVKFNISETLRKDDDKKQICEFITKNDYMTANILLEKYNNKYGVLEGKYETALNMVKAAHARIQFDFESASRYIDKAQDYDSGSRAVCDRFIYFIKELQNKQKIYLLNELKNNAIYEYENGAYTDFLGRVFRSLEDIYRFILIKKNILKINENDNLKLNKAELESAGIIVKGKLNVPQMSTILEKILEKESEEYKLYIHCTKMDKLRQIRNDSVLAHGYKGVSKDKIDREIGNAIEFLGNLIVQYKKVFNIEINDDHFYDKNGEFNSHLIKLIEEI